MANTTREGCHVTAVTVLHVVAQRHPDGWQQNNERSSTSHPNDVAGAPGCYQPVLPTLTC